jgi:Papain-like cysteine protease AvrRpt2
MELDVDHKLPTAGYGQFLSTTCWYASYRMLYAWKKRDESEILQKLSGAGLKIAELNKRGLYEEEFPTAAGALGLVGWQGNWVKSIDLEMIVHLLKFYGPLFCATDYEGNKRSGHAVVLVGYNGKMKTFKLYNPYNRSDPGNVDIDYWTFDKLRNDIHDSRFAVQAW